MSDPMVLGVDLSLTATGLAHPDGSVEVFKPRAEGATNLGLDRMVEIRDHVIACVPPDVELVVIEALAFDGHDRNRQQAQLTGMIRAALFDRGWGFYAIPPNTLKKYATGNGHADKHEVIKAADKRLGYDGHSPDEADALWLRAIGWALLETPVVELPLAHQNALLPWRKAPPVGLVRRVR
jgi:Holliday junction resolvasome RuvABC endonuclease subunit